MGLFARTEGHLTMAAGKGGNRGKRGKKGRKDIDAFAKKEWYHVKAPALFRKRNVGQTLVNKTQGTVLASDTLKGRVFEVSLGDLNQDEDQAHRKIKLIAEDVQGRNILCNFHGMSFTTDKLCSLVRKWHTLIEANVDVRTTDGYTLRLFAIGFTKRRPNQNRKTSYAQAAQVRTIRKVMIEIMKRDGTTSSLTEMVQKFIPESMGRDIEKATQGIYPLHNVFIRKVKMLKAPKTSTAKVLEMHGGSAPVVDEVGAPME